MTDDAATMTGDGRGDRLGDFLDKGGWKCHSIAYPWSPARHTTDPRPGHAATPD